MYVHASTDKSIQTEIVVHNIMCTMFTGIKVSLSLYVYTAFFDELLKNIILFVIHVL